MLRTRRKRSSVLSSDVSHPATSSPPYQPQEQAGASASDFDLSQGPVRHEAPSLEELGAVLLILAREHGVNVTCENFSELAEAWQQKDVDDGTKFEFLTDARTPLPQPVGGDRTQGNPDTDKSLPSQIDQAIEEMEDSSDVLESDTTLSEALRLVEAWTGKEAYLQVNRSSRVNVSMIRAVARWNKNGLRRVLEEWNHRSMGDECQLGAAAALAMAMLMWHHRKDEISAVVVSLQFQAGDTTPLLVEREYRSFWVKDKFEVETFLRLMLAHKRLQPKDIYFITPSMMTSESSKKPKYMHQSFTLMWTDLVKERNMPMIHIEAVLYQKMTATVFVPDAYLDSGVLQHLVDFRHADKARRPTREPQSFSRFKKDTLERFALDGSRYPDHWPGDSRSALNTLREEAKSGAIIAYDNLPPELKSDSRLKQAIQYFTSALRKFVRKKGQRIRLDDPHCTDPAILNSILQKRVALPPPDLPGIDVIRSSAARAMRSMKEEINENSAQFFEDVARRSKPAIVVTKTDEIPSTDDHPGGSTTVKIHWGEQQAISTRADFAQRAVLFQTHWRPSYSKGRFLRDIWAKCAVFGLEALQAGFGAEYTEINVCEQDSQKPAFTMAARLSVAQTGKIVHPRVTQTAFAAMPNMSIMAGFSLGIEDGVGKMTSDAERIEQHQLSKRRTKEEQDAKVQERATWIDEKGVIGLNEPGWHSPRGAFVQTVAAALGDHPKIIYKAVLKSESGRANHEWWLRQAQGYARDTLDVRETKKSRRQSQRVEKQPEGLTYFKKEVAMARREKIRDAARAGEVKDSSASGSGTVKKAEASSESGAKMAKKFRKLFSGK